MATMIAKSVASSFLPEDIPTKPHWSLYVSVAGATVAVITAVVAYQLALLTQAGILGALGGTSLLSSFYIYRFSRDHSIVVAGRAQKDAVLGIQETIVAERETLVQMGDLVEGLKDERFSKDYAKEAAEMKKVAADLLEIVNNYRKIQEESLVKTKKYTDQVVEQLKAHNVVLTATNKKGETLLQQAEKLEKAKNAAAIQLDMLLGERRKGTDLLQGVQTGLQEGLKHMKKYARINNRLVNELLGQVNILKTAEGEQNASIDKLQKDLLKAGVMIAKFEEQLQRLVQAKGTREAQKQGGGQ